MTPDDLEPANLNDVNQAAGGEKRASVPGDLPANVQTQAPTNEGEEGENPAGGSSLGALGMVMVSGIILASVAVAYLAYDKFVREPEAVTPPQALEMKPSFGRRDIGEEIKGVPNKDRGFRGSTDIDAVVEPEHFDNLYDESLARYEVQRGEGQIDFRFSTPDTYPFANADKDADSEDMDGESEDAAEEAELPVDREQEREALSPSHDAYPASGRRARDYLVLLRNALNKPNGMEIDLEKCFILLSMYYNPNLDPKTYLGFFQNMASELYGRLTTQGEHGRIPITDPQLQANIVTEFMLHGAARFRGWDVQEYHPQISGAGSPLTSQNFLVDQVFSQGEDHRNESANTTLNLLTLILVRKLAGIGENHFTGNEADLPVFVPLYGVRLPDRTVLRYDAAGADRPLPNQEIRNLDDPLGSYTRNIEYLRNGNHYNASDYVRRMSISESDRNNAIYLWTLDDREFFATLGYELAQLEVFKGQMGDHEAYKRAQTLLEEWVLDRDDGTQGRHRDSIGERPTPRARAPRGDLGLRDAHLLYAQMLLQVGDFERLKLQIDENPALLANADEAAGFRGMLAHSGGRIEEAIAHLEDAISLNTDNARAHLYLGDIYLLMHDGSTPDSIEGTDRDKLHLALRHLNNAEVYDQGTLTGAERFLLHYRRSLAYGRKGEMLHALEDLGQVKKINPAFSETPRYDDLMSEYRIERAFQVLEAPSSEESGELKFQAVRYLESTLSLNAENRPELLRCARLFGHTDNLAAEWELSGMLRRMSDEEFGRDSAAWERWIRETLEARQ